MSRDDELRCDDRPSSDESCEGSGVPSALLGGVPERMRRWVEAMFLEHETMRRTIARLEDHNRRLLALFLVAEQQRLAATNRYVLLESLFGARNQAHTISLIEDALVDLIKYEKAAIFEVDPEQRHLVLLSSIGIDADRHRTIPLGAGIIGTAALTGQTYIAEDGASPELTACVPLRLDGQVRGVIALFELPSHKPALTPDDRALLEMFEKHAATALLGHGSAR